MTTVHSGPTTDETTRVDTVGPTNPIGAIGTSEGGEPQPRRRPMLRRLPEFEPPLDGAPAATRAVAPIPPPLPILPSPPSTPWSAPTTPEPRRPTADEAAARAAAVLILRRLMEVLDGRRAASHLQPMLNPPAYRRVVAVTDQLRRRRVRSGARLRSVHTCHPASGAAEVSATWELDGRPRALAARFERGPGRPGWRCTALLIHV